MGDYGFPHMVDVIPEGESDGAYQSAMEARRWLDGEELEGEGDDLVSEWKSLAQG